MVQCQPETMTCWLTACQKDCRTLDGLSNNAISKMSGNGMHLPSAGFCALMAMICTSKVWWYLCDQLMEKKWWFGFWIAFVACDSWGLLWVTCTVFNWSPKCLSATHNAAVGNAVSQQLGFQPYLQDQYQVFTDLKCLKKNTKHHDSMIQLGSLDSHHALFNDG